MSAEDHYYEPGDFVRLVQNKLITGQIIGERDWGREYNVRIAATVTSMWFSLSELEPDDDPTKPGKEAPVPVDEDSNVIALDAARKRMKGE